MHSISSRYSTVYLFAIVCSVIFSSYSVFSSSVINTDAVCYLQSAESLKDGLSAAMHACTQAKWPFYSILIAGLVYITKFSYIGAAYFLNGIFSIISTVMFISIVSFIGETIKSTKSGQHFSLEHAKQVSLLWFAAIVILLSNEFNSVKYYIIRDHGFWAFYLLSIFCMLHFFRSERWLYCLGWSFSLLVATLFRIEGAVFLIMLPWITFFNLSQPFKARVKVFFKLNVTLIFLVSCLAVWVMLASPHNLGRLSELSQQLTHGFSRLIFDFNMRANQLSIYVLSPYSARYSSSILLLTLVAWYLTSLIKNVSLIYSVLVIYAWSKKLLSGSRSLSLVLWAYFIVNFLITAIFLAEHMFLSKRYLIAFSLVIMIWVPFALQHLYGMWSDKKWPLLLALLIMIASSLGGLFQFGHSKDYIYQAGTWLEQNTPSHAKIVSNDILVMYYSHRFGNELFENEKRFKDLSVLQKGKWKQYDYLALRLRKKNLQKGIPLIEEMATDPVKVFSNTHGDQVRIYKSI